MFLKFSQSLPLTCFFTLQKIKEMWTQFGKSTGKEGASKKKKRFSVKLIFSECSLIYLLFLYFCGGKIQHSYKYWSTVHCFCSLGVKKTLLYYYILSMEHCIFLLIFISFCSITFGLVTGKGNIEKFIRIRFIINCRRQAIDNFFHTRSTRRSHLTKKRWNLFTKEELTKIVCWFFSFCFYFMQPYFPAIFLYKNNSVYFTLGKTLVK